MSTGALVAALMSGLVWLGVIALVGLAWVDDHRRENEAAYSNSLPASRGRGGEATAPPAVVVAPPPLQPVVEAAEVAKPPEPEAAGFWQIHTLQNGEGS